VTDIDQHGGGPGPRRIPADIDQPDRVLAGLTARQLIILAAAVMLLIGGWHLSRPWLPTIAFLAVAGPVGLLALAVALGRHPDGTGLDTHLLAAAIYWLRPRQATGRHRPRHREHRASLGHAPHFEDPVTDAGVPDWLARRAVGRPGERNAEPDRVSPPGQGRRATRLRLPVRRVAPAEGEVGVLDVGHHGLAVLAALTPVPFTWASAAQQQLVLDSFTRLLCAIDLPLQILIRAVTIDLHAALDDLRDASTTLPHPALAAAAADHHDYLADLHTHHGLVTRQVLLVLRDPRPQPRPHTALRDEGTGVVAGSERLLRALEDAHAALSPAGIELTPLTAAQAETVLAASTHPTHRQTPPLEATYPPVAHRSGDHGRQHATSSYPLHPGDPERPDETEVDWDTWDQADEPATGSTAWDGLAGWLPERVQVDPGHVVAGGTYSATLAVLGYPRQVYPGWLTPLLNHPAHLDLTLHIEPLPTPVAARRLRQQQARLESTRALDADHGRLADPRTDTAAADAADLATRLARGDTRLHRLGLYLTVHAPTEHDLSEQLHAVRALASSMLLDARPSTYRALRAWTTTLPIGIDALDRRRVMDTDALASTVPITSTELPAADPVTANPASGVLYGHNLATGGLVIHDRFTAPNHNAVILASSGAGKSYLAKLELLRSLYRGIEVIVIDPEDEYARLAEHVGGTHLRLGAPDVRINPFDLPHPGPAPTQARTDESARAAGPRSARAGGDVLTRRALYVHTVLGVLLGELTPHERVLADRAIHTAYTHAGISTDPMTWTRPAPLLADLAAAFTALGDPVATDLAHRLTPFVTGSFRALFDGPTSTAPSGHLIVYSLKDLPEQLLGIGTLTALDATWRTIANPDTRRPRLVVVDEAWLLLQHPAGAQFLLRLAKAARKHWAGLTLITQDATDLLATDLGRAVISNAATHILLRTAPQAATRIATEYDLTEPERAFLTTAATGTGLLITPSGHHIPFSAEASPSEDLIATTDPAQLAAFASPAPDTDPGDTHAESSTSPDRAPGFPSWAGGASAWPVEDEADPL
jgi:hypothetical protein